MSATKNTQNVRVVDATNTDNRLGVDGSGRAAVQNPPNLNTGLTTRASEATLDALKTDFNNEDFATQATLDGLRTDFGNEDFASETTLDAIRDNIGEAVASPTADTLMARLQEQIDLLTTIDADTSKLNVDLDTRASETTLDAIRDNIGEAVASPTADTLMARIQEQIDLLTTIDADTSKLNVDLDTRASEVTLQAVDTVLDTIFTRQNDRTQKTQITNGTLDVSVTADAGVNRLEIQGKVQSIGAIPPPATTPVVISADTPLTVGTDDTTYVIPDGEIFHLQQITCGNEDPTKGAVVVVLFDDGSEHVIEQVYTAGFTVQAGFADIVEARDGTSLVGNPGGTNVIVVRRQKYSGSDIAIDAEVIGYVV